MDNQTPKEIAQHYKAMIDSVNIINSIVNEENKEINDEIRRNVIHLELMLSKNFWIDEDMTSVYAAISAGKAFKNFN